MVCAQEEFVFEWERDIKKSTYVCGKFYLWNAFYEEECTTARKTSAFE